MVTPSTTIKHNCIKIIFDEHFVVHNRVEMMIHLLALTLLRKRRINNFAILLQMRIVVCEKAMLKRLPSPLVVGLHLAPQLRNRRMKVKNLHHPFYILHFPSESIQIHIGNAITTPVGMLIFHPVYLAILA